MVGCKKSPEIDETDKVEPKISLNAHDSSYGFFESLSESDGDTEGEGTCEKHPPFSIINIGDTLVQLK